MRKWIFLIMFSCLLIGCRDVSKNGVGNLINSGLAVCDDIWIYFSDLEDSSVYKMTLDGQNITQLSDDLAQLLSLEGEHLIYYHYDDREKTNRIVVMDLNTEMTKTIVTLDMSDYVHWVQGRIDGVYYQVGKNIYKVDYEGENVTTTVMADDFIWSIIMNQEDLYYIKGGHSIVRYDSSTQEEEVLIEDKHDLYGFVLEKKKLYYLLRYETSDLCEIYELDVNTLSEEPIYQTTDNMHSLNLKGDWLYAIRDDRIVRIHLESHLEEEVMITSFYEVTSETWDVYHDTVPMGSPMSLNLVDHWLIYSGALMNSIETYGIKLDD